MSYFLEVYSDILGWEFVMLSMLMSVICVALLQSVDNEIVLWEPKMKEQSPGEVRVSSLIFLFGDINFLDS